MAVLCEDLKLLFIMVPGTGCNVVSEVLRRDYGGVSLPSEELAPRYKHASVDRLVDENVLKSTDLHALTVFTTVRN